MDGISKNFTRRGLKKCPKCKQLNGVRASSCKNCKLKLDYNKTTEKLLKQVDQPNTTLEKSDPGPSTHQSQPGPSTSVERKEQFVWNQDVESLDIDNLSDIPVDILQDVEFSMEDNLIYLEDFELTDCQIELMDEFSLTDKIDIDIPGEENFEFDDLERELLEFEQFEKNLEEEIKAEDQVLSINNKIQVINKFLVKKLLRNQDKNQRDAEKPNLSTFIKLLASNGILLNKLKLKYSNPPVYSPEQVIIDFNQWLNSIIETIWNSMEFNGNADSRILTFSVNHNFFKCLSSRFTASSNKKRKANRKITITKGLHKGLQKSTWTFNRLLVVKQIFETEQMSIETEQKFMKISENPPRYEKFVIEEIDDDPPTSKCRKISPKVYSTRLKVNPKGSGEREHTFTISWTPNVLKKSQYGEMEINFFYQRRDSIGHKFIVDKKKK